MPQLAVETGVPNFLLHDRIGSPEDSQAFTHNGSQYTNRQAGARERLTPDDRVRQAQLFAENPHFVLEQLAEGLNESEPHPGGKSSHIVMRFDGGGGALETDALDHIRVQGALNEVVHPAEAARQGFKVCDKESPDDFAFTLRIRH